MALRVVPYRKLSADELMLLNCGVGEYSWESLGLQGDPTSHSKGDQPWVFFGRTDAKAETPVLWPPHAKSWLIEKDSDAGRDWGQEEKGMTEDEMARWHHGLNTHEFEWTLEVGDGQEAWHDVIHGVTKNRTQLSDWTDWTEVCHSYSLRSQHLLILWLHSPSALILEPRKMKSGTVSTFSSSVCHEVMGPDSMILVFWMLSFKSFFTLLFHLHQEAL